MVGHDGVGPLSAQRRLEGDCLQVHRHGGFIECKFPCGESLMTELPAKYIIADGTIIQRPVTTEVMRKPAAAPKRPVTTEVVMRKPAAAPSSAAKKRKVLPGPKKIGGACGGRRASARWPWRGR